MLDLPTCEAQDVGGIKRHLSVENFSLNRILFFVIKT
jgi:hypothetical protein